MAVIGSNLRVALETDPGKADVARQAALTVLDEAEALFGPGHVLYRARQMHAKRLAFQAWPMTRPAAPARVPPRTAWEHDAVGRILLAAGEIVLAEAEFERVLALVPQDLWSNFHQGVCAFRLRRYDDAVNAFRVCIALAPDRAEFFYNRALAYSALDRTVEAARDYARAFSLDPSLDPSRQKSTRSFPSPAPPPRVHH